jgi:glycosyltransferase involved in cell wall biosynthesis
LKNVEQLVVVSENMKAELSFYVSSNCQIHIISQFINLPEELNYNHRNETSIEILTVTNFGFKGKSEALKLALKQFLADERVFTTNISWSICGAGHFMQDFQAAISQNILPKNVNIILHGYQSEISLFYRNADLFLYTSFIDALPNVVLEAMSFGLPVLVNLEMWTILDQSIRNRCYFFDLSNSVSLMDQLATIIDEPFSDIYIANRDFIRTNFSKREIGSKWHNLLNSVLNISS